LSGWIISSRALANAQIGERLTQRR
jgi:hypothetical protein